MAKRSRRSLKNARRPLGRIETLEDRIVFSINPTGFEQELMESINRMRTDPQGELDYFFISTNSNDPNFFVTEDPNVNAALEYFNVDPTTLFQQWSQLTASPPLAFHEALISGATAHSQLMKQYDQQSHQLPGEAGLGARLSAAGYANGTSYSVGENVFAYAENPFYTHAAFAIDWGNTPTGIQTPAGHRQNIMSSNFTELGVGVVQDSNSSTSVGPNLVTQDFGGRGNYQAQLVGVVFTDTDADTYYDAGDGVGGVTITLKNPTTNQVVYTTTTWAAGGYQLVVAPGTYDVYGSGGSLLTTFDMGSVTIGSQNVKVDLDTTRGTPVAPSTGTLGGTLFEDPNEDTLRGRDDGPRVGWTIYLDANQNGQFDSGETTTVTNSEGSYTFFNVPAGSVTVGYTGQPTYRATNAPGPRRTVTVTAGQTIAADFSTFQFATLQGSSATIQGLLGNDVISWTAGSPQIITTNGYPLSLSGITQVTISGRTGNDQLVLTGAATDDTATLTTTSTTLVGTGYNVSATSFENVTIHGGGGAQDVANFYDGSTNDTFESGKGYGIMIAGNSSFSNQVVDFDSVYGYATAGGTDVATMHDSPANDIVSMYPTNANMKDATDSYYNYASGFDQLFAIAGNGGADQAKLYDSAAADIVNAHPGYTVMTTASATYYNYAAGFEDVLVTGTQGGNDIADMYDAPGADRFVGGRTYGLLRGLNGSFYNYVTGFKTVIGHATAGGNDYATLNDSASTNDNYNAYPTYATMSDVGNTYLTRANGFNHVFAYASGGTDKAYLHGSTGNDRFVGYFDNSSLSNTAANFYNAASGFDETYAYANGGYDTGHLLDSAGDDQLFANPVTATMQNTAGTYLNSTTGFDSINASAVFGGHDVATLQDGTTNDRLVANSTASSLEDTAGSFYRYAGGFDQVLAYASQGGDDRAFMYDSPGNDTFTGRPAYSVMTANNGSYYNFAQNFNNVVAYANRGGTDTANLHDGAGDDRMISTASSALLYDLAGTFSNQTYSFESVVANSTAGGLDYATLYDGGGNDMFTVNGQSKVATLSNTSANFSNTASGFDGVFAYATGGGNDTAQFYDSTGSDSATGTGNYLYMDSQAVRYRATGFDTVRINSNNGGTDTKNVNAVDYVFESLGGWI